jgi:hypothetical protein
LKNPTGVIYHVANGQTGPDRRQLSGNRWSRDGTAKPLGPLLVLVAAPLRFRRSTDRWTSDRVRTALFEALDSNLGATSSAPWFKHPDGYEARRFEMGNGDIALFCWNDEGAYWLGNTETPQALWDTDKYTFEEVPEAVAAWAERELLAQLHAESPWLADYPTLSWFFLPVFLSKDGRETTRTFFREHAAGFPDADRETALSFYEDTLETDALTDRYTMAAKLGTSQNLDWTRMAATMSEFTVARILHDAGYEITPEVEVTTGHSIDYGATRDGEATQLVEVTRPLPPDERSANSPVAALRETAATKASGQLQRHGGGVTLFVDCSSFSDSAWRTLRREQPDVHHSPAVVFRARPDGTADRYEKGTVPIELG